MSANTTSYHVNVTLHNFTRISMNLTTELDSYETDSTTEITEYDYDDHEMSSLVVPLAGRIIHRVILPVICACGIIGILLTVIVLSRKHMFTSTNCYLMALAVTDLMFLILLATTLADNRFIMHSKPFYIYVIYVTYASIFMHICLLASIWLTVMLAIERYFAICKPFLANKVCTIGKARIFIIAIYTFAILCRLANFWESKVVSVFDSTTNTSFVYSDMAPLSLDEHYIKWYPWIIDGVVTSMIPFLLLVILNLRLIHEVRKSTQYIQRNLMNNEKDRSTNETIHKEEMQITIMLISVIIVFFLCQAPYVIYTAIVSIYKFAAFSGNFMLFRYITMLLLTLKSAVNFIIYCWFSEKFWVTLKTVCFRKCPVNKENGQPSSGNNSNYQYLRRISSAITRDTSIL